jgi:16S rRNA (guanine966-N2)-methyltransferase
LRIVAGRHRGRTLKSLPGPGLRPTSDRARESVFNILAHGIPGFAFEGSAVVDVFCGTGAFGLEALSRGAARATFVDSDAASLKCAKENAARLGEWRKILALRLDAAQIPPPPLAAHAPCALAFLDPPYGSGLLLPALQGLGQRGWLAPEAIVVAEMGAKETLEPPRGFTLLQERVYGAAKIAFLRFAA